MWVETSELIKTLASVGVLFFLSIFAAYRVGKDSGFRSGFKEACECKSNAEIKLLAILEEKLKAIINK